MLGTGPEFFVFGARCWIKSCVHLSVYLVQHIIVCSLDLNTAATVG